METKTVKFVTVKNSKFIEEIVDIPINFSVQDIESRFVKWVEVTNGAFWQECFICDKCGMRIDRQGYMRDIDWKRETKYHQCRTESHE
jgi:hypothetical protein